MRRVVITGLGMVAPCGNNVRDAWASALEGRSGVKPITHFDASDLSVRIAASVEHFAIGELLDPKEARRVTRFVQFAVAAAHEAMMDSGLAAAPVGDGERDHWGASIGVGIGGLEDIEDSTLILEHQGPRRISPFFMPYCIVNMAAGVVSRLFQLRGPNICTTTACASGTHAVGEAFLHIRTGLADVMVAGGSESAISKLGIAAFAALKALSTHNENPVEASRPFDLNRDGFVMGEGSGVLVMEDMEHAKKRGAKIYAEMVGYGMSGDAHHITAPSPGGEGAQRCMKQALRSAGIAADAVSYINAHGTSTELNDKYETAAIQSVFGEHVRKLAISSTKGVTGHCLGAAGGIEAVFSALALHHSLVPPTANLHTPDPDCALDYTPLKAREKKLVYAMSNSFGFGGTNATIVLKRFDG